MCEQSHEIQALIHAAILLHAKAAFAVRHALSSSPDSSLSGPDAKPLWENSNGPTTELRAAITELEKAVSFSGEGTLSRGLLANAYGLAGERGKAMRILDELKALSRKRYVSPLDMAVGYTGLGDRNSAFQWLEKAYQERTMRIQQLPEPVFDTLRPDPRFGDLMRRIGLAQ